jgi:aromatic amino acid aminotransferase I
MSQSVGGFVSRRASGLYSRLRIGELKKLYKYYTPTSINLAGGLPMESTFPFDEMSIKMPQSDEPVNLSLKNKNLFLQYHRGDGIGDLKEWAKKHVASIHGSHCAEAETCLTVGSTDALAKSLQLLDGDTFICDQFAYGAAVSSAAALGRKCIGVEGDSEGMSVQRLIDTVVTARKSGHNPDVLYLVPVGQNPTGMSMTPARKSAIYKACQDLDLIILEDGVFTDDLIFSIL